MQRDVHLERSDIIYSEGPDRAWLHHHFTNHRGQADREAAALWVLESPETTQLLATGLGAPKRFMSGEASAWEIVWIAEGQIARRTRIGLDQAVYLLQALAAQNVLDYHAHLFGA
ncbi:hypothetical protein D9M71_517050 [compost metagenome]